MQDSNQVPYGALDHGSRPLQLDLVEQHLDQLPRRHNLADFGNMVMVNDAQQQLQGSLLNERVGIPKEASHACLLDLRQIRGELQRPVMRILDDELINALLDANNQLVVLAHILAQKLEQRLG